MCDKSLLKQALDALERTFPVRSAYVSDTAHTASWDKHDKVICALRAAIEQGESEPVADDIVAGALYDFLGYLTTRRTRITLSGRDDAGAAVDALVDWSKTRKINLDEARVKDWNTYTKAPVQLSDDDYEHMREVDIHKLQAQGEPIGYLLRGTWDFVPGQEPPDDDCDPVYMAPVNYVPLSDEVIDKCMAEAYQTMKKGRDLERHFARAIERAVRGGG